MKRPANPLSRAIYRFFGACVAASIFAASSAALVTAGEAFFSADGTTVITSILLPSAMKGLAKIDIATGKATQLPLPAELKEIEPVSLARGAEGEILFLANEAVWVMKEGAPAKKVTSTAPVKGAIDLFVGTQKGSPLEDWLFVSGVEDESGFARPTLYARKPGGKKFEGIFCRRVDDAGTGAFSADGRLFFVSSGDLWEGMIEAQDDMEGRLGVLLGARLAPLAFLNTDDANGGGMYVTNIFPVGKWIYTSLSGRHMGAIARTPLPAKPLFTPGVDGTGDAGFPSVRASFDANAESLTKTEIITEDLGDIYGFCATEMDDKPLVFFHTFSDEEGKGPALMLWNGAGEPKVIGNLPVFKE